MGAVIATAVIADSSSMPSPYLSVVVTTRNDDHGGDPLKRLQVFVNCLDEQCRRTGLDAEVIVVEWNPPADRPRIASLLRLPECAACTYRFIEVPSDVHRTLRNADVLPMYQMIAKNVGVRRARGRFVLVTNIDIVFSTELVAYIALRQLDPTCLYRVDRHDVQSDVRADAPLDDQLRYCVAHHLRLHTRWGSYPVESSGRRAALAEDIVDGRSVRLGSGWHVREARRPGHWFRWASQKSELIADPAAAGISKPSVLEIDLESNPHHDGSWADVSAVEDQRLLGRTRVTGATRLELPIDPASPGSRRIELHVIQTDSAPELPLFERRGELKYRVSSVRLRPAWSPGGGSEYPRSGWSNANAESGATLMPSPDGLVTTTDRRRWSYCARYGPLRARKSGKYRFELAGRIIEGDITVGVLTGGGRFWISSAVGMHQHSTSRWFEVEVDLLGGLPFWLVISNNHPDGDGVSVFVIHRLDGPADMRPADTLEGGPQQLLSTPNGERVAVAYARAARARRATLKRVADACRHLKPATIRELFTMRRFRRLNPETRQRIVQTSPEFRTVREALDRSSKRLRDLDDLSEIATFLRENRPQDLHLNGCGDFQLMAREHWERLRGYPEFETFSMNIDAMLSYMADADGLRESTLGWPIYHLEHEIGSGWSPEGEALLQQRIAERGITWLDAKTVHVWAAYMRWLGRPMVFNGPDWGFARRTFAERPVGAVDVARM